MQIKPHQIPHFAEQQRRFKLIGLRLHEVHNSGIITEWGSYFSSRFKRFMHYVDGTVHTYVFKSNNKIKDSHDDIIAPGAFSKSLENNFWKIGK